MKTITNIIVGAIILTAILPKQTYAIPYNSDWCDAMYSELHFKEVPQMIQKECNNRFIYLTNIQKSYFRNH